MSSIVSVPAPRGQRQRAHLRAIATDPVPAVKTLTEILGKALLAVIVNRDVKTITRWIAGQGLSRADEQKRIQDTLQIVELLLTEDSPTVVRAWFMGMNPELGDESPAEVLSAGHAREVMAAARSYTGAS